MVFKVSCEKVCFTKQKFLFILLQIILPWNIFVWLDPISYGKRLWLIVIVFFNTYLKILCTKTMKNGLFLIQLLVSQVTNEKDDFCFLLIKKIKTKWGRIMNFIIYFCSELFSDNGHLIKSLKPLDQLSIFCFFWT